MAEVAWSEDVDQGAWIAGRQPAGAQVVTVPTGYQAYARVLHPIEPRDSGADGPAERVRWAQVAAWSGVALGPTTPFWRIALPEHLPDEPMPGDGAPASDVLGAHDGAALVRLLRGHTSTPERCWFAIWEGYGWDNTRVLSWTDDPPPEVIERLRDPVPAAVRAGPRVRLPARDYLLYCGPAEAGLAFLPAKRELADLWWPEDRAWFVYGDVDLSCTYVGGPEALVTELVASIDLEAFWVDPADPTRCDQSVPHWLADRVDAAVDDLMRVGSAELATSRFVVRLTLGDAGRAEYGPSLQPWGLQYRVEGPSQRSGGLSLRRGAGLPVELRREVTRTVIDLAQE